MYVAAASPAALLIRKLRCRSRRKPKLVSLCTRLWLLRFRSASRGRTLTGLPLSTSYHIHTHANTPQHTIISASPLLFSPPIALDGSAITQERSCFAVTSSTSVAERTCNTLAAQDPLATSTAASRFRKVSVVQLYSTVPGGAKSC